MIAARSIARPAIGRVATLTAGLAVVTILRVAVNGPGVTGAFVAGAVFGGLLIALGLAAGWRPARPRPMPIAVGIAGGLVLIALPAVARPEPSLPAGAHPDPFALWVAVTLLVAAGEEAILRGVLFDALLGARGPLVAVAVTSLAFALLHVPLYGWHVVPLDLAVGIWLAGMRMVSGGVAAPAVAHGLADLATWWL